MTEAAAHRAPGQGHYDWIAAFVQELRAQEGVAAQAFESLILRAARTGEVIGARWNKIDINDKIWIVPAERIKGGRENRVPLSSRALAIVEALKPHCAEFVFPRGKPLSNMALLALLKRMKRSDLTAHGFRSTFRDWAAERTNYPRQAAEMAIVHMIGDKVDAGYRRGDLFETRRGVMEEWAKTVKR